MAIGLAKKVGAMVFASGLLVMVSALLTDNLIMGSQVESSTIAGSTTTYTYDLKLFEFTEWHKILFVLAGAIIMVGGFFISNDK